MNDRISSRAMALGLAVLLAGCAGSRDCTPALEAAEAAARGHQPPGAWINDVAPACSDPAMSEWTAIVARECAPVYGFHSALTGGDKPSDCSGNAFDSAWSLGEMVSEMRREVDEIEQRLEEQDLPPETRRELQRRLIVIGRDLPQIEALARMDGYLPPAEIPDSQAPNS